MVANSSVPARTASNSDDTRSDFPIAGIGASAGGLEACLKLVEALPAVTGMAFILVQHLDPMHESLMVQLLSGHTPMIVREAKDGVTVERDRFYVMPPGGCLTVVGGVLRLALTQGRHGSRLPFDHLLQSLAADRGPAAAGVVLSGTGGDGSLGVKEIKAHQGFAIAQDPEEAGFDGMPRGAIATGVVDLILPVAKIAEALVAFAARRAGAAVFPVPGPLLPVRDWLPEIVAFLRANTAHDFTLYKDGTIRRRVERRVAIRIAGTGGMESYLEMLRRDPNEAELLAKDLLIHVTRFFRDRGVFEYMAAHVVPDLIAAQPPDGSIRVWIAGCSTGEETYSIAMLFREQMGAQNRDTKLQVFASDADADAVAEARIGRYPDAIAADVSPARLARFFVKEDGGYRISAELRAMVVFTVQDLLTDPPFSRIDLVSCRNLLIYLRPEAQAKVISLFHFALRKDGILLLGGSETAGEIDGRFEIVSKPERLYRRIGPIRWHEPASWAGAGRPPAVAPVTPVVSRQAMLAELCRQLVIDHHAPAAVLVNRKLECLHSLGPIDRFLRIAPGAFTHDLMAMAHQDLRAKLRFAIQQAIETNARAIVPGASSTWHGQTQSFNIDIDPVTNGGEALLLICFVDIPEPERGARERPAIAGDMNGAAALEQELEATRTELRVALRSLEISSDEQKSINEEALSAQEEYQSTNEELLTSKEELQALNEELTALNSQLQETLERQRTTSNDLQNILYSTDVATIFLDSDFNIRFFTPATRALFGIIPSDIGRPLADLKSLTADNALLADAKAVLQTLAPVDREINGQGGVWYVRRILPYRTQDDRVEGVVITFSDITERTQLADAMGVAQRDAEQANMAKSRFLAAASHDLRQPLQTLSLLRGVLAKKIRETRTGEALALVVRLGETADAMTSMLNTVLDINQIESGTVHADISDFRVSVLFQRLADDFTVIAEAQGLSLHVVPSALSIRSDPQLLEQMLRNLIANALKYTRQGKVLLGCRRHGDTVRIEVWDTGIGIPDDELQAIFGEYHQIGNVARERSHGLGLGLTIVKRLGTLLGHEVRVRSRLDRGSMFSVEVARSPADRADVPVADAPVPKATEAHRVASILVIEDDPEVRDSLEMVLTEDGHRVVAGADGSAALELVTRGTMRPDLILADYNLPDGMNGLEVTLKLRSHLRREVPIVILTGDIATGTMRDIAARGIAHLNKPVEPAGLLSIIQGLLPPAPPPVPVPVLAPRRAGAPTVFIVDDDDSVRAALREVLEEDGQAVESFASCEAFLEAWRPGGVACLVVDAYLPGMDGLELLRQLREAGHALPSIMITGSGDVSIAIQAMKAGVSDFIEKPVGHTELLACVARALEQGLDSNKRSSRHQDAAGQLAGLTQRQRQIMELVLIGHPSKNIAADLGISQRTVENHRASIMKKTGSKSLPALARLAIAASAADGVA